MEHEAVGPGIVDQPQVNELVLGAVEVGLALLQRLGGRLERRKAGDAHQQVESCRHILQIGVMGRKDGDHAILGRDQALRLGRQPIAQVFERLDPFGVFQRGQLDRERQVTHPPANIGNQFGFVVTERCARGPRLCFEQLLSHRRLQGLQASLGRLARQVQPPRAVEDQRAVAGRL